MDAAIVGIFLAAYWVINDLLAPDMCYTQIKDEPQVWMWVECDDLKEIQLEHNF